VLAADPAREPTAAEPTTDSVEAAITRSAELLQRAVVLGEDAARQRAQLDTLRSRLETDSRKQAAALTARAKELDDAHAQVTALQKQLVELRAVSVAREATPLPDLTLQLKAKEVDIVGLRV